MAGKSHDYFDVNVFDKLHFGDSGINELEITILKTQWKPCGVSWVQVLFKLLAGALDHSRSIGLGANICVEQKTID